ncbi:hypothetical protein [Streptomyces sp. NPDC021356]|uniref:hypothetical protein n=1 Tax=Streptomyces sp. NPDC021356 TaxID=3154900 RepID=UPI00340ADA21
MRAPRPQHSNAGAGASSSGTAGRRALADCARLPDLLDADPAGTLSSLEAARDLRAETRDAGITAAEAVLELALAFHHAALGEQDTVRAAIDRLHELARTGDYAYYADIAHYMGGLPLPGPSTACWLDGAEAVRDRWHCLVETRQAHLGASG